MENQTSLFEKISTWINESITVKLASIGFLVLILLIPQSWIGSLIVERQARAAEVVQEIASKWSGEQVIAGPVLILPFLKRERIDKGKDGIETREWKEKAFFLPEKLNVAGAVNPERRHRGIFDAAVYQSSLTLTAEFLSPDLKKLNIAPQDVVWNEAYLILGISDLRGISEIPVLKMGDVQLTGEPSNAIGLESNVPAMTPEGEYNDRASYLPGKSSETGIVLRLPWQNAEDFRSAYTINLNLKGSTVLNFAPTGKTTEVSLSGPWANPSFGGEFLPSSHTITAAGFQADWKILHFNRPFPQQWTNKEQKISGSEFGVKLLIPVDQYQKSIRTAKYGILIILLTFISLLMVEIIKKVRIHPFQYILVGVALIIYYSLLLSLSEHLGYNLAYAAASIATVMLVVAYSITFLRERKTVALFGLLLMIFYGFIFVIIQQQDYSLLIGSVGLFIIVGVIMYFSRNIKWYK